MYGPPQAPQAPQPPKSPVSGGRIALLVLFSAFALLSCGFLAWVPLLHLASVTRRARDWVLFGTVFLLSVGLFAYAAATGDEDPGTVESFIGVGVMVLLVAGSLTHYLVVELRQLSGGGAATPPYPSTGYGYGTAATVPSAGGGAHPYAYAPPAPQPPAMPAPPQPAVPGHRIDQVRAELDELSDLLRKDASGNPREGDGGR
ncbi:hypothetical protein [Streptomyces sp. NPDC058872]|uniref:hypothetical protein n=1 Tax=Streptomyces sp. NPDC058872 TaxID=3346661 RepID=UPI0036A80112